nr:hypothetical protein [Methylobacterium haplocladii]
MEVDDVSHTEGPAYSADRYLADHTPTGREIDVHHVRSAKDADREEAQQEEQVGADRTEPAAAAARCPEADAEIAKIRGLPIGPDLVHHPVDPTAAALAERGDDENTGLPFDHRFDLPARLPKSKSAAISLKHWHLNVWRLLSWLKR